MAEASAVPRFALGTPALALIGTFVVILAGAWLVTIVTGPQFNGLMMLQVGGAAPTDRLLFLSLAGVMMTAMMLPAAIPMVGVYRSLAIVDGGRRVGNLRATIFSTTYLLLWTVFTGVALVVLVGFGLMSTLSGPLLLLPGVILVAAGIYQYTSWKQYCLRKCRSPLSFLMTQWRGGTKGAFRMGLSHAGFCLGCCWLLMLVVFVTGAMSLLWMGVFSGFILVEKTWSRGEWFSRVMGIVAMAVGILVTGWAVVTPGIL